MTYTIDIVNWSKYNPKRDQVSYSWFRMNNDFFLSADLFGLTSDQKLVWVVLLCLASKSNSSTFEVNPDFIAHHLSIKKSVVVQALELLCERGLATIGDRALSPVRQITTPTNVTNERTNERTNTIAQSFDFAEIYNSFPRKLGKSKGLSICKRIIRTAEEYQLLRNAVQKYKHHVISDGVEPKFIMHFSTFMGKWQDWLDDNVGSSDVVKKEIDWNEIFKHGS